jgi:hypothetical protein
MGSWRNTIIYKGRSLGILVLTAAQLFIGIVHIFFGLLFFAFDSSIMQASQAYYVYTFVFGLMVSVFAYFIWQGKRSGWIGAIATSVFVIAADALTLLDLPSIPGIPKLPALTEIAYSILIIVYLSLGHVRRKFFS